ncbi:hypothetical protein [Halorhodospira sp. 9622]|uniref:hypothetical protein n=1 Tax=Halorhodospira sp. 9622 TaxID=2899136 RepID=UPI001EE98C7C|nr:hypothetical protein [Halorhodospira sp. 9622]MCG5537880.1 hypothetical protein [Halorhodospira sp. 9622]
MQPIICLDFDGVIHSYESGWQGGRVIPDGPVPGAFEFILDALGEGYQVAIHSSRSHKLGGRRAMKRWMRRHAAGAFLITNRKPWIDAGYQLGGESLSDEAHRAGRWLVRQVRWPLCKPPALVTIDDRGYRFMGVFPNPEWAASMRPWNKV